MVYKPQKLAHRRARSGCDPEGGARAVPGRGFANCVRAVRKLARPATMPVCQELAARGADLLSATMKRGTGLSQGRKVSARAAVERRKASAFPKGARAANPHGGYARMRGAVSKVALFGAPPPSWGTVSCSWLGKTRGANKKRSARTRFYFPSRPRAARWGGVRGEGHF
jgi:hypothetical protein